MKSKDCMIGFILAFLGGALAGLSFSMIPSRLIAGAIAGGGFFIVGIYCFRISMKASKPWFWVTFYTSLIHLFGVSLPMVITRWMDPSMAFAQMKVWGIPGHQFHVYSTNFYYTLMLGLFLDGLRSWWLGRGLQKQKPV